MKILGIICGRSGGNSELLAKQALIGARENGAETELVNLSRLELKACIGCGQCHDFAKAVFGACPLRDDFHWLEDKILDANGLIIVMPCYEKSPPSEFKLLMDRTGPANDVYFRLVGKQQRAANPERFDDGYTIDERSFHTRFAAFIAHGGTNWTQLGLPMMLSWCTGMGLTPVDKLELPWNLGVATDRARMERVRRSGAHVAACCAHPEEAPAFLGEKGHCPICHSDAMILGETADDVRCAVCSARGKLAIGEDNKLSVSYTPDGLAHSTLLNSGRKEHYDDMMSIFAKLGRFDWAAYKAASAAILDSMPVLKPERNTEN